MWEELMSQLFTILTANTKIQETYKFEKEKFSGIPACTITPSENESDYFTNKENERMYTFNVRLFISRSTSPSGGEAEAEADRILRTLVDTVLDDFDKNYILSGITNPTGYTFINLFAIPSSWGYAGREDEYRAAEITVRCRVLVDVNLIS